MADKRVVQINAVEANIFCILALIMEKVPKALDPTLPIMQPDSIFSTDLPCLVNIHIFLTPSPKFLCRLFCNKKSPNPDYPGDITRVIYSDLIKLPLVLQKQNIVYVSFG